MVCEFHFNPKQILVSLGIGKKTYVSGSVPSVFEFKPEEKKKERKPPKPRNKQETFRDFQSEEKKKERKPPKPHNKQETSRDFETESSDSQCFGGASISVVDVPEDIQHN